MHQLMSFNHRYSPVNGDFSDGLLSLFEFQAGSYSNTYFIDSYFTQQRWG